jgi:hypothetical protein
MSDEQSRRETRAMRQGLWVECWEHDGAWIWVVSEQIGIGAIRATYPDEPGLTAQAVLSRFLEEQEK